MTETATVEKEIDIYDAERVKLLQQFRKEFGEQSMFLLGKSEKLFDINVRSSGSLMLDLALGGGFAQGRMVFLRGGKRQVKRHWHSWRLQKHSRLSLNVTMRSSTWRMP